MIGMNRDEPAVHLIGSRDHPDVSAMPWYGQWLVGGFAFA